MKNGILVLCRTKENKMCLNYEQEEKRFSKELDPFCPIDVDEAIKGYKEEMNHFLGSGSIDELQHIREFFMMKDSKSIPDNSKTRYMSIDKKEYQSRKAVLPSVESLVEDKQTT